MNDPPRQFSRIADSLDLPRMASSFVVVVGAGTVGSQVARELAHCGVGRMLIVDHDPLKEHNLVRHALPRAYVGMPKADGLASFLSHTTPTLRIEAVVRKVDSSITDLQLDRLFDEADLIIAATDDRDAQRRIARRSLALDIPAVLPGLYGDQGGEVFVQRSSRHPCFFCWDGFRRSTVNLRSVAALNASTLSVLQLVVELSIGLLDTRSEYARMMAPPPGDRRPRQIFVKQGWAGLSMAPVPRRPDCQGCAVGPSELRPQSASLADATGRGTRTAEQELPEAAPSTIPRSVVATTIMVLLAVGIISLSDTSDRPTPVAVGDFFLFEGGADHEGSLGLTRQQQEMAAEILPVDANSCLNYYGLPPGASAPQIACIWDGYSARFTRFSDRHSLMNYFIPGSLPSDDVRPQIVSPCGRTYQARDYWDAASVNRRIPPNAVIYYTEHRLHGANESTVFVLQWIDTSRLLSLEINALADSAHDVCSWWAKHGRQPALASSRGSVPGASATTRSP